MALLEVRDMSHRFGGLQAVRSYNLDLSPGQVKGLIGPNGAGKTTIFNLITGIYRPTEGRIRLDGQDIIGRLPHRIASLGLARTFQEMRLWRHMSVLEHVKMACYARIRYGLWGAFFGTPFRYRQEAEIEEKAFAMLEMMKVGHLSDQLVTNLPYGAQRRVEMARAMAMEPKILFLDEPTVGMTPEEMSQMMAIIYEVRDKMGVGIFLIEHRMRMVMELCQEIQTLVFGQVIAQGTPEEIQNNEEVIEAYLGKDTVET